MERQDFFQIFFEKLVFYGLDTSGAGTETRTLKNSYGSHFKNPNLFQNIQSSQNSAESWLKTKTGYY